MNLSWEKILENAVKFSARWQTTTREEACAQPFVLDFIQVFTLNDPLKVGEFEAKVARDEGRTGYIDYLWPKIIAVEMKSPGKDLKKAYEQLKDYVVHLPPKVMPALLLVCDFERFLLYDRASGKKISFKLKELRKHIRRFAALAGYEIARVPEVWLEVNVNAAEKMATLHDALLACGYSGHNLELYLVRLLFCLFAEDTGIFPQDAFLDYILASGEDGSDLAGRLEKLFEVLDLPPGGRAKRPLLSPVLLQFQYIDGKLFSEILPQAEFDAKMRQTLIQCAKFDWSKISPAIFGSIFQGVMDKTKRRRLGAHYTNEENILKVINPLFMDDLWAEFENIKASPAKLKEFHNKIASLKFLDPACGCGNFLIVAYRELRRLEHAVLKLTLSSYELNLDVTRLLKVGVHQFYGVEIEEFPAQIARVGLWLMDHQMNLEAGELFGVYCARFPLAQSATIANQNALLGDWLGLVPGEELNYIMGNPPFAGARIMSLAQKSELESVFSGRKFGDLDYVAAWFAKADAVMKKYPQVKTAFVATNSVSQGGQAALLWQPILENGAAINFAHRTFKWNNDARGKAAVHCVIVGFNRLARQKKYIFYGDRKVGVNYINPYLDDVNRPAVESRPNSLWNSPEIGIGNKPIDGGNYLFTREEKEAFLREEPAAAKYFHKWLGAREFLHNEERYCLWLGDCPPHELKNLPECLKRVAAVKKYREESPSAPTRKLAQRPTRFHVENMPESDYLLIPSVSSEKRNYVPIGFIDKRVIASNLVLIVSQAGLYHFGILSSSAHNAWIRAIAGRLEMRYRYSKDIVYNNFPWPNAKEKDIEKLEALARNVLDARACYPESSPAVLYDPLTMPADLLKAHRELDKFVLKLYGLSVSASESDIVTRLFRLYQQKIGAHPATETNDL